MFEDTKYRNILDILGVVIIVLLAVQLIGHDKKTTVLKTTDISEVASSVDFSEHNAYRKIKASNEQIKHQKEINSFRKSQGLPELKVRDYVYVSDNHPPVREIKTTNPERTSIKPLQTVAYKPSKTDKTSTITATSRTLTEAESKISHIRSAYSNYMEYCVRKNWKNPTGNNKYSAAFTFNMDKNGRITAYDVLKSSESLEYNKAAIQCLLNTAPFKPIPNELQMEGLNAQIYFNGVEVQVNGFSKISPTHRLTYDVDQSNKTCKTLEIYQAKNLRTQSSFSASAPSNLHWEMSKQVQSNWNPPLEENSSVSLTFRVLRNGAIQNIKFETRAFDDNANVAAYNTIKNLKLAPFPSSVKSPYVDVKYWFYVESNIR